MVLRQFPGDFFALVEYLPLEVLKDHEVLTSR